jgi:hypothetical protein
LSGFLIIGGILVILIALNYQRKWPKVLFVLKKFEKILQRF